MKKLPRARHRTPRTWIVHVELVDLPETVETYFTEHEVRETVLRRDLDAGITLEIKKIARKVK